MEATEKLQFKITADGSADSVRGKNVPNINYYEWDNDNPILLIIHAQGTNAENYSDVVKDLSKKFHLILVDCYGHGKSSHNKEKYNIVSLGDDLIDFIKFKSDDIFFLFFDVYILDIFCHNAILLS